MFDVNKELEKATKECKDLIYKKLPKNARKSIEIYTSLLSFSVATLNSQSIDRIKKIFLDQVKKEKELMLTAFEIVFKLTESHSTPAINNSVLEELFDSLPEACLKKIDENATLIKEEDSKKKINMINIIIKKNKFDIEYIKKDSLSVFSAIEKTIKEMTKNHMHK